MLISIAGGLLLLATPVMAQHQHTEDNPKYNSSHEDLSYEGWQKRARERDQEELRQMRKHEMERMERKDNLDRWSNKNDILPDDRTGE